MSSLFVDRMTTDDKYCPRNMQNFQVQFEAFLFKKKKQKFSYFFLHFWNVHEIWNILTKNMSILA